MTTGTEADLRTLRSEVAQLRADFAKVGETLQDLIRHGGAEAMDKAQESAAKIVSEAKRRARSVTDEIEERPVTAALTAFGVGLILGMLFSGRRS